MGRTTQIQQANAFGELIVTTTVRIAANGRCDAVTHLANRGRKAASAAATVWVLDASDNVLAAAATGQCFVARNPAFLAPYTGTATEKHVNWHLAIPPESVSAVDRVAILHGCDGITFLDSTEANLRKAQRVAQKL